MGFGFERVKTGRLSGRFRLQMVASRDSGLSAFRLPVIKTIWWFWQASQTTASEAFRGKSREGKVSSEQLSSIQRSRHVSESQIETSAARIPSTSLSARIAFIAIPSPACSCSLAHVFQEPGVASVELRLELRGISLGSSGENALVFRADFFLMLLDIAK